MAYSGQLISLSQLKYVLDILDEVGCLGAKPVNSPIDANVRLDSKHGDLLKNLAQYRRLVGKLNYLTFTKSNISFTVSTVSQFMSTSPTTHWNATLRIMRYLKGASGRVLLFTNQGNLKIQGYSDAD